MHCILHFVLLNRSHIRYLASDSKSYYNLSLSLLPLLLLLFLWLIVCK